MPLRDGINKLRGQFDKVLDKFDSQHSSGPPPVPYSSRPGQTAPAYGHYPQQQWQGGRPPPPPMATKPLTSSSTAQVDPGEHLPVYWNPHFVPQVPVSEYFDYDLGAGGWGNNELQTYTSNPGNSFHNNLNYLVLRCIVDSQLGPAERFTSARLLSKQRLGRRRGYLSATIAAPRAKGIWPAFWLLPEEPFKWPQDGEVDLFEAWNGGNVNHSCLHWGNYTDAKDKKKHRVINTTLPSVEDNHEYGFAWDQIEGSGDGGYMIWYIDGKPIMRAQRPPGTRRLESWRILLNIAVGGTVCNGARPADGTYNMVVSRLLMSDEPPGGWYKFGQDWNAAPEGRQLE